MTEYDNTNRGQIWGNEKKREGKQDPDFTGSLNVDGREYWISAWKRKEGASAKAPALSLFRQAEGRAARAPAGRGHARRQQVDGRRNSI
jgi:hypothetical protein